MTHRTNDALLPLERKPVHGMCTHCGSVEVQLVNGVTGYRDLSDIGESDRYPVGYGCEVCS
jgi:hypothetical protein